MDNELVAAALRVIDQRGKRVGRGSGLNAKISEQRDSDTAIRAQRRRRARRAEDRRPARAAVRAHAVERVGVARRRKGDEEARARRVARARVDDVGKGAAVPAAHLVRQRAARGAVLQHRGRAGRQREGVPLGNERVRVRVKRQVHLLRRSQGRRSGGSRAEEKKDCDSAHFFRESLMIR